MKLAAAQLNVHVGNLAYNVKKIKSAIQQAAADQVDLLVFSECALTGYPPKDWLLRPAMIQTVEQAVVDIIAMSRTVPRMGILLGLPVWAEAHYGAHLANAVILIENGQKRMEYHKQLLPNTNVFDESRYFTPGTTTAVIPYKGHRVGITICEDAWHLSETDPVPILAKQHADIIINVAASPYETTKSAERDALFQRIAKTYRCHVLFVNQVGGVDGLVFDGRSMLVSPCGGCIQKAPAFDEAVMVDTIDTTVSDRVKAMVCQPKDDVADIQQAIQLGIRDYVKKSGLKHVFVGLSGGIDSAVVATVAVNALGADHVTGIGMPGPFSSDHSLDDAQQLAHNLGIQWKVHPINASFQTVLKGFDTLTGPIGLPQENMQARLRGLILLTYANQQPGGMVLTTGNKSELAVGYCTLYGDMNGGLAPIGDVYKTTVYALAKQLNKSHVVIPKRCLTKPPSAELAPDQTDQDRLPDYAVLDGMLQAYLEKKQDETQLIEQGYEEKWVSDVIALVKQAEHKRYQSSPVIKVSAVAFDQSWRHVIVSPS